MKSLTLFNAPLLLSIMPHSISQPKLIPVPVATNSTSLPNPQSMTGRGVSVDAANKIPTTHFTLCCAAVLRIRIGKNPQLLDGSESEFKFGFGSNHMVAKI
jgi:hypothetical protein